MPDTIVLSSQTDPALQMMTQTLYDQWASWKADLLAAGLYLKLFVNDVTVSAGTALPELTEASAPGYAPLHVTTLNGPFLDQEGNAYMTTPEAVYTTTGGGTDLCYGAFLVMVTGAAATATFTLTGGQYTLPVITSGGSGYLTAPRVTVTGATGTGAKLTAVLTGGAVTSITIDDPGAGYTTATATLEAPMQLIVCGNFPVPRPLQVVTDAVPVVVELDNLAA